MARHRGTYKPEHESPYELSRSRIESFIRCPACFWLDRAKGVKFPGMPAFLLNSNTDKLLKRDFDRYRGKEPHPIMIANGLGHLIPFDHPDMACWENSLSFGKDDHHFNTLHEETNILFGGGLDDVWQNIKTGENYILLITRALLIRELNLNLCHWMVNGRLLISVRWICISG